MIPAIRVNFLRVTIWPRGRGYPAPTIWLIQLLGDRADFDDSVGFVLAETWLPGYEYINYHESLWFSAAQALALNRKALAIAQTQRKFS